MPLLRSKYLESKLFALGPVQSSSCREGSETWAAELRLQGALFSGKNKPGFSKPCLFLSDTRHFRRFRRFRGSEERSPCFQWVECKFVIFAVFVKTALFLAGDKNTVYQKTRFAPPRFFSWRKNCLGVPANGGVTNGGLRGVWPPVLEIGRNRPFSPFFCLFRPFLEGLKSTWKIQENGGKGLFPQISTDFLKPPSLKPPFAAP